MELFLAPDKKCIVPSATAESFKRMEAEILAVLPRGEMRNKNEEMWRLVISRVRWLDAICVREAKREWVQICNDRCSPRDERAETMLRRAMSATNNVIWARSPEGFAFWNIVQERLIWLANNPHFDGDLDRATLIDVEPVGAFLTLRALLSALDKILLIYTTDKSFVTTEKLGTYWFNILSDLVRLVSLRYTFPDLEKLRNVERELAEHSKYVECIRFAITCLQESRLTCLFPKDRIDGIIAFLESHLPEETGTAGAECSVGLERDTELVLGNVYSDADGCGWIAAYRAGFGVHAMRAVNFTMLREISTAGVAPAVKVDPRPSRKARADEIAAVVRHSVMTLLMSSSLVSEWVSIPDQECEHQERPGTIEGKAFLAVGSERVFVVVGISDGVYYGVDVSWNSTLSHVPVPVCISEAEPEGFGIVLLGYTMRSPTEEESRKSRHGALRFNAEKIEKRKIESGYVYLDGLGQRWVVGRDFANGSVCVMPGSGNIRKNAAHYFRDGTAANCPPSAALDLLTKQEATALDYRRALGICAK